MPAISDSQRVSLNSRVKEVKIKGKKLAVISLKNAIAETRKDPQWRNNTDKKERCFVPFWVAAPKQNTTADVSEPNLGFCYVIQYRVSRKRLLFPRSRSHAKPSYPVRGQLLRDSGAKTWHGGARGEGAPRVDRGRFLVNYKSDGELRMSGGRWRDGGPRTIRGRVFHNYYYTSSRVQMVDSTSNKVWVFDKVAKENRGFRGSSSIKKIQIILCYHLELSMVTIVKLSLQ